MSPYHDIIMSDLRSFGRTDVNPSWVEAYLRLEFKTLDGLSKEDFRRAIREIIGVIDDDPDAARDLAKSYGLRASQGRNMNDTIAARELMAAAKLLAVGGKEVVFSDRNGNVFSTARDFETAIHLWKQGRWNIEVDGETYRSDFRGREAIEKLFGETYRV